MFVCVASLTTEALNSASYLRRAVLYSSSSSKSSLKGISRGAVSAGLTNEPSTFFSLSSSSFILLSFSDNFPLNFRFSLKNAPFFPLHLVHRFSSIWADLLQVSDYPLHQVFPLRQVLPLHLPRELHSHLL